MSFKQESIHLIAYNQYHQFCLTKEAKNFLISVRKPIAIVTITGIYRTGKSYLINKLMKNKQNGFEMGSNVSQTTKGLNIWGRPILAQDEKGNKICYLVIDSEGIGSFQKQAKYDMKLLMLIFLISSTVVFNSMGAIDQMVLDQLRVILKIKDNLHSQQKNEKPKLVWILRDFSLQLVDRNGIQITSNEYLQNCLQFIKGNSLQIRKKNEIRKAITQGFGKRCCFTLVRPTIQQSNIQDLSKCILRQQFLTQIQQIRQTVFSGSRQDLKIINGSTINGELLFNFLQECIDKINRNQRIQVKQISQYITEQYQTEYFNDLNLQMQKQISQLNLPMPQETMKQKLNQIQNKFYKKIQNQCFNLDEFKKYHRQFLKMTNKVNRQINSTNKHLLKARVLKQIKEFIKQNIDIQNIQPTNLSIVKIIIERIQLKIKGQVQAYDIVLSTLFNIMERSQIKAVNIQREVNEQRKLLQLWNSQRKNTDFSSLAIKKQLHEALQIINNLKFTQQQLEKQLLLLKNQQKLHQNVLKQHLLSENQTIKFLNQYVQQHNLKFKTKIEEYNIMTKKLREENNRLIDEIEQLKTFKLEQKSNRTKQFIFQDKMKEILGKKQNEMNQLLQQINNERKKYEELKEQKLADSQNHKKYQQKWNAQQKQYLKQLQSIKTLHTQNKKTYNETLNAIKDNDRAFKNIQNISFSNSKVLASCKKLNFNEEKQAVKRYEEIIDKLKLEFDQKQQYTSEKLNRMTQSNELMKKRNKQLQSELQRCKKDKFTLQNQLSEVRQRFADTVSQIQMNKEKQRSFYEESIVRLLSTLDKRQSNMHYFSNRR